MAGSTLEKYDGLAQQIEEMEEMNSSELEKKAAAALRHQGRIIYRLSHEMAEERCLMRLCTKSRIACAGGSKLSECLPCWVDYFLPEGKAATGEAARKLAAHDEAQADARRSE